MRFSNGAELYKAQFTLGDELEVVVWGKRIIHNCRFVKVTHKGFNIIDLDTNRVFFKKKHLYGINMRGKEYPSKGLITINCWVPSWLMFIIKRSGKDNCENPISALQV